MYGYDAYFGMVVFTGFVVFLGVAYVIEALLRRFWDGRRGG